MNARRWELGPLSFLLMVVLCSLVSVALLSLAQAVEAPPQAPGVMDEQSRRECIKAIVASLPMGAASDPEARAREEEQARRQVGRRAWRECSAKQPPTREQGK